MKPRLSFVATSRNDDHGGNIRGRTQAFVDGLADQAQRFSVPCELILVEWNPPANRPPLAEALDWPDSPNLAVRIVTVPPERHARVANAAQLPLFQMIGKNVGIRRANGEFVVATNVDILLSDAAFRLAAGPLEERTVYRTDRFDIDETAVAEGRPPPAVLRAMEPLRIDRRDGTHYPGTGTRVPIYTGIPDLVARTIHNLLHPRADKPRRPWRHYPRRARSLLRSTFNVAVLPKLHLNACGDFTLISRRGWFELRGYAEWEMFSMHIDSLLLYHAHARGFAFVDFPADAPVLHIDHSVGSGWTPEGEAALFGRLESKGIAYLTGQDLGAVARSLKVGQQPTFFNLANWGLADEELPEVQVTGRPRLVQGASQ